MYLSRVEIDLKNRQKIKDLNHLGAYHNWVEQSFQKEILQKKHTRKLWRIDRLNGKRYLLIVSEEKPDLKNLERYGVEKTGESKEYNNYLNSLENEQVVKFKATLNPVYSVSTGKKSGERGKTYPCVTVSQQMKYLLERAEKNGFFLEEDKFYIIEANYEKLKKKNKRDLKINKVTYQGELVIKDIEKFKNILINGLGKKKAYGCGMITVII